MAQAIRACSGDGPQRTSLSPQQLLDRTLDWRAASGFTLPGPLEARAQLKEREAGATETVVLTLFRSGIPTAEWDRARFIGMARSRDSFKVTVNDKVEERYSIESRRVILHQKRDADTTDLLFEMPKNRTGGFGETWDIVVAICQADTDAVLGFATMGLAVSPHALSAAIAIALLLLAWLVLTVIVWKLNAHRLQHAWLKNFVGTGDYEREAARLPVHLLAPGSWQMEGRVFKRLLWKVLRAANPVFIAQDALGCGSLSRFQLFLFSCAVATVVVYIFLRIGTLPDFSADILQLLGISAASATLSRFLSGPGLSVEAHRVLYGLGMVKRSSSMPTFGDLIAGQGEIDVTRVQALMFTLIVVGALVVNGTRNLAGFDIPDQMIFLLGLSQGVYILGKAVPTEISKRLNDQIRALFDAARKLRDPAATDPSLAKEFSNAKAAASATLEEIYGENFRRTEFEKLTQLDIA